MPRAKCRFRETEVTRDYRAIEKAGKKVASEIDQAGKIVLVIDNDGKNEPESSDIKL